jgi:hypothetical protein
LENCKVSWKNQRLFDLFFLGFFRVQARGGYTMETLHVRYSWQNKFYYKTIYIERAMLILLSYSWHGKVQQKKNKNRSKYYMIRSRNFEIWLTKISSWISQFEISGLIFRFDIWIFWTIYPTLLLLYTLSNLG